MEIKLPKSANDLRIKHLKPIETPKYDGNLDLDMMLDLISEFTGIKRGKLMTIDTKDIVKMANHIINLYANMNTYKTPPKEITVNGVQYELINPEKVGVGWHLDWRNSINTQIDPIRLACLMYFNKGEMYGATDENENILFPISSRYNDFENHLPLDIFLSASSFFLSNWTKSMIRYTQKEIKINQARLLKARLLGQNQ